MSSSQLKRKANQQTQYYNSEYQTATAWSEKYRKLSGKREYSSFIYVLNIKGEKKYYTGTAFAGMGKFGIISPNVILPFLYQYFILSVIERLKQRARIAAFLHTHPKPPSGSTYKYHSAADLFLLKLPGIKAVYVIPYENKYLSRAAKKIT